ncbi:hypothetical protein GYMLUDRAFT_247688 [Collybiopsis luxurians FD-317 M1]|uniref:Uncharacterized protein n=1 Tax=Collybiopsis luxurians FD-317 M1 TaxID=944289 RepID=A0A0D0BNS1_9AGAR|nr:hypothetical protein GYMLUDRAFT_247688 [Collybiopsis luxurians FD-317 M1]
MTLDEAVEPLVHRYLQNHKLFPFSNATLGDVHQLSLDQIAVLHFQHEQEALRQLCLEIRQWLLKNYGENPDFEAAASNLHSLKFNINLLVKAEFIGQAIEVANAMALGQGQPQPYADTGAAKLACMQHAIEVANAEALRQGLPQPYPDVEAVLQHNGLIPEAEQGPWQHKSPAPTIQSSAITDPKMGLRSGTRRCKPSQHLMDSLESGDNYSLRVVSSTSRGVRWTVDK